MFQLTTAVGALMGTCVSLLAEGMGKNKLRTFLAKEKFNTCMVILNLKRNVYLQVILQQCGFFHLQLEDLSI